MPPERSSRSVARPLSIALTQLAVAGAILVAIEVALIAEGPFRPTAVALLYPAAAAVYLIAGILASHRRPGNRTGALLVLGGFALLAGGLTAADVTALIAAGQVTATVILAVVVHLLLAFPSGRLRTWPARALAGLAYFISTILQAPLYLFADGPDSPYTALRITADPDLASLGSTVQRSIGAALMTGVVILLAGRLRAAPPRQRRVLAPVFAYGIVTAIGIPLSSILLLGSVTLDVVQVTMLAGVAVAFLLGLRLGGFARTAELEELGAWLGSGEHGLAAAVADALGDPSVELVFWSPEASRFVDRTGAPVLMPAVGTARGAVEVAVSGGRVGAILYDTSLIAEPETVRAAGRVVGLALDRERLRVEIASAGDHARRRLARDLHDGLQSRLVVLGLQADLLGHSDLREGLNTAIAELRELVDGTMPAILVERGLYQATQELVISLPLPVELVMEGDAGSLPEPVESGAYFILAEALTNAVKHSRARDLGVLLRHADGTLRIEVRDDGIGGAAPGAGSGVRGMEDRAAVLGGRFSVDSPRGAGTRLVAELPCV